MLNQVLNRCESFSSGLSQLVAKYVEMKWGPKYAWMDELFKTSPDWGGRAAFSPHLPTASHPGGRDGARSGIEQKEGHHHFGVSAPESQCLPFPSPHSALLSWSYVLTSTPVLKNEAAFHAQISRTTIPAFEGPTIHSDGKWECAHRLKEGVKIDIKEKEHSTYSQAGLCNCSR